MPNAFGDLRCEGEKFQTGLRSKVYYIYVYFVSEPLSVISHSAPCKSIRINSAQKCIECRPGVRFPTIPYPPPRWSPAEWPWRRADRCDPAGSSLAGKTRWLRETARRICPPHAYLHTRSDARGGKKHTHILYDVHGIILGHNTSRYMISIRALMNEMNTAILTLIPIHFFPNRMFINHTLNEFSHYSETLRLHFYLASHDWILFAQQVGKVIYKADKSFRSFIRIWEAEISTPYWCFNYIIT